MNDPPRIQWNLLKYELCGSNPMRYCIIWGILFSKLTQKNIQRNFQEVRKKTFDLSQKKKKKEERKKRLDIYIYIRVKRGCLSQVVYLLVYVVWNSASLASLTRETGPKVVKGDPARKSETPKHVTHEHHHFTPTISVSDSSLKFTHILYNLSPAGTCNVLVFPSIFNMSHLHILFRTRFKIVIIWYGCL